jgi:hypothetical protein
MKQALTLGLVIIALSAFNPFLYAQNKTGYVSIDEVVQLMPEYKKATGDMAQYDSTLQIEYAETLKELNRQDSLFKMDSTKMSPAAKNAKKELMKKLLVELQGFEQGYQQKMQQKQEEALKDIQIKLNKINHRPNSRSSPAQSSGFLSLYSWFLFFSFLPYHTFHFLETL